MKMTHKLASLTFAIAATLSGATFAGGPGGHGGHTPEPSESSASITDVQMIMGNSVVNDGTENNAKVNNALKNSSGNAGVNVSAGDTNQQANAAAISTADAEFVFASSSIVVGQFSAGNVLSSVDVTNNAKVNESANNYSGNLGLNVAAGAFNQQKNDVTIASSEQAQDAEAAIGVLQVAVADTTYSGVEEDDYSLSMASSWNGGHGGHGGGGAPTANTDLTNNATLVDSLNNVSGNVGVNIAAGGTNQQSNSLSIAAGCNACM